MGRSTSSRCIAAYHRGHVEELVNLAGRPKSDVCLVDYGSSIPVLVHEAKDWG